MDFKLSSWTVGGLPAQVLVHHLVLCGNQRYLLPAHLLHFEISSRRGIASLMKSTGRVVLPPAKECLSFTLDSVPPASLPRAKARGEGTQSIRNKAMCSLKIEAAAGAYGLHLGKEAWNGQAHHLADYLQTVCRQLSNMCAHTACVPRRKPANFISSISDDRGEDRPQALCEPCCGSSVSRS